MLTLDETLAHFGIKGMHWGTRRTMPTHAPSEDHARATAAKDKSRKSGTKALSNKELQDLITRMNLEQQYSKVVPPTLGKRILKNGSKFAADVLTNVGKQQASKLASDHASRVMESLLKK